jgi:uncharacterized protein YcaQ
MTGTVTIAEMRARTLAASLVAPTTLADAVDALGFVQADPIRAPSRAQDLILRHRVAGYRAGDLDRNFVPLGLEEDFLYAHGFMPGATMRLLHPRPCPDSPGGRHAPTGLAADVLAFVRERGTTHPRDLETRFGREPEVNGWGGVSKATTRALQRLHYFGLLRIVGRKDGIRIYAAATPPEGDAPLERARRLAMLVTRLLAPIAEGSLGRIFGLLARGAPGVGPMRGAVAELLTSGALERGECAGEHYLWPASAEAPAGAKRVVRFLAPFDPIVWERRRFEHLWGWPYRFEAYTVPSARRFGYYAMPLLWGDAVIGWVNLTSGGGTLDVAAGFAGTRPKGRDFARAFDAEMARMQAFLGRP